MNIVLSPDQEVMLLAWAAENTRSEVDADVEPSGFRLHILVSPYGAEAEAVWGTRCLYIGEVSVLLGDGRRARSSLA